MPLSTGPMSATFDSFFKVLDETCIGKSDSQWRARQLRVFDHLAGLHALPDLLTHNCHYLTVLAEEQTNPHTGYPTQGQASELLIEVRRDVPEWVTIHELGHWLDFHLGAAGRRSNPSHDLTAGHPALKQWREAVYSSPLVKQVKARLKEPIDQTERKYLEYIASARELWARSYTQWALGKDPQLAGQIELYNDMTEGHGHGRIAHWSAHEFAPIGIAVEIALSQLTLVHPPSRRVRRMFTSTGSRRSQSLEHLTENLVPWETVKAQLAPKADV
jgi:hypothetical protein